MTRRCSTIPAVSCWPKSLSENLRPPPRLHTAALTSAYLTLMTNPASADTASRKPVMLTGDDDPGVSRAVARDLRRKYGDAHRIVRAESGPDALDTLKQLKLRGETVAMLVADYRMPQMTG